MLIFGSFLCFFVLFIAVKKDLKSIPYGEFFFIIELNKIKLKIWRVTFLKSLYHKEIMGWTSSFPEMTNTSSEHCIWDHL